MKSAAMKISKGNRAGFATLVALIALSLVGVTVVGLMRQFSIATVRTQEEADRAELRQLIIAGSLSQPGHAVILPDALVKSGAGLDVVLNGDTLTRADARFDHRQQQWYPVQQNP